MDHAVLQIERWADPLRFGHVHDERRILAVFVIRWSVKPVTVGEVGVVFIVDLPG
jgi:hypothetical protein